MRGRLRRRRRPQVARHAMSRSEGCVTHGRTSVHATSPRLSPGLVWRRWLALLFEHIKFARAHLAAAVQRPHQRQEARVVRAAAEGELVQSAGRRRVPLDPVPLPFPPCDLRAPLRIWPSVRMAAPELTDDGFAHGRRARDRRRPQRWQRPSSCRRRRSQSRSGGSGRPLRALAMRAPRHRWVTLACG